MIDAFTALSHVAWDNYRWPIVTIFAGYIVLVGLLRYRRMREIQTFFTSGKRQLSSMTVQESYDIITQLQTLEFPYAFSKARRMALLKVRSIQDTSTG